MSNTAPLPRALPFRKLQKSLARFAASITLDERKAFKLSRGKLRIPMQSLPLVLSFGKEVGKLQLLPETALSPKGNLRRTGNLLLRQQKQGPGQLRRDVRLAPGQSLALMRDAKGRVVLPGVNANIADPLLTLKLFDDELLLQNPGVSSRIRAKPLDADSMTKLFEYRIGLLRRLREMLGAPIAPAATDDALDLLQRVNQVLEKEAHRPTDRRGKPGGLVSLPDRLQPVIVGALHGRSDNLLAILSRSTLLEGLQAGTSCLIILGDAIHRRDADETADMQQSMAMMDMLFRLKLRFPEQVFYLRGNLDGFSEASNEGVSQGVLWWQALKQYRGKAYRRAMETFYSRLPCIATSRDLIACHAGAPTSKPDRNMLIDSLQYPGLEQEMTDGSRIKSYSKGDVKRLRKSLGLAAGTPFIVGHPPEDGSSPLDMDRLGIPGHHLVYSGAGQWVGAMAMIEGCAVPFRYPAEPLTALYNSL